jgi:UDP-N-acetyl-D-galactosamine dehydrogenase
MKKEIVPCVIGLGYVGLPVFLRLQLNFKTVGFDINKERISTLKNKHDYNKEFRDNQLILKKNSYFTFLKKELTKANFYIVTVPTPINFKKKPDLRLLKDASYTISKYLKKGDIIVYESTVYPGTTHYLVKKYLEKYSKLKEDRDFYVCYSPERVNPGDVKHSINKIKKIIAIKSSNKIIQKTVVNVYKKITTKLVITRFIEEAEAAKVIENIQRDLNIALMNDLLIYSDKMGYNFQEILRLASTKWNFLKFNPGLVGGHCLPVDPYYLYFHAQKNKIKLKTLLAGREVNNYMKFFVKKKIERNIKRFQNKSINPKILICGLTYKKNVSDIRNSFALDIYLDLKKKYKNVNAFDYVCNNKIVKKYRLIKRINNQLNYHLIVFLVNHKKNSEIYQQAIKNKIKVLDIFNFY